MGYERGRNSGVTGIVDISGTPKFHARIYRFSLSGSSAARVKTKPADTYRRIRQTTPGNQLALTGKVQLEGFPVPSQLKGATGEIVVQLHTGVTCTLQVAVTDYDLSLDEKTADVWNVSLVCEVTANPALAGFTASQVTVSPTPSSSDDETAEGRTKGYDPDGLQDSDTRRIDIEGLAGTDAAEATKIADLVTAAVASRSGMKVRRADLVRDDAWSGVLTLTLARTTTGEDVVNGATVTSIDTTGIGSTATTAAINGTPPTPTGADYVHVSTSTRELNDSKTLTVYTWALRTTEQGIEMDGTVTNDDQSDLFDSGVITQVTTSSTAPATPSAPAGTKIVRIETTQINPGKWRHVFHYARRNNEDAVVMDGTSTGDDPNNIDDAARITSINGSSTPPATPAAPVGTKIRRITTEQIHDGKWKHVFEYARRDTADDVTMEGTADEIDPDGIDDAGRETVLDTDSTPPATPAAPGNSKLVKRITQQIHDGRWKHVFIYGPRTSGDEITMGGTVSETDVASIRDEARITQLDTDSTPPAAPAAPVSGTKHVRTVTQQVKDGKWRHTWFYAPNDAEDEIVYGGTRSHVDGSALEDKAEITQVTESGTAPSAPAAPITGTKHVATVTQQINPGKWRHTFLYLTRNPEDEIEFGGTVTETDASGLTGQATITQVTTSGTPPATPAAPTGLTHRRTRSQQVNDAKWKHTFTYGEATEEQEQEYAGTSVENDPDDLADEETIADVTNSGTPPATPSTTISGLKHRRTETKQLTTDRWRHLFKFGRRDPTDDVEMDATVSKYDVEDGRLDETATVETCLSSDTAAAIADAQFTALNDEVTFVSVSVKKLHDTRALVVVRRLSNDLISEGASFGGLEWVPARLSGGNVQVFMAWKRSRGTGLWEAMLIPQRLHVVRFQFEVQRRKAVSPIPDYFTRVGTTNASTFLGFSAGQVTYIGHKIKTNHSYSPPPSFVRYRMEYSSLGHFDFAGIHLGHVVTTADLSAVSVGWVDASVFGFGAAALATADFSVFTA